MSKLSQPEIRLTVKVRVGEIEKEFSGSVEDVMRAIFTYVTSLYPQLSLLSGLTLTVDMNEFLKDCEGVLAITPEGVVVLRNLGGVSDKEQILVHLAKTWVGYIVGKSRRDTLSIGELLSLIGKPAGTVAPRLSELVDEGFAMRVGKGEYKITTYGLDFLRKNTIPKLKG